jgi:hypothetical protein
MGILAWVGESGFNQAAYDTAIRSLLQAFVECRHALLAKWLQWSTRNTTGSGAVLAWRVNGGGRSWPDVDDGGVGLDLVEAFAGGFGGRHCALPCFAMGLDLHLILYHLQ